MLDIDTDFPMDPPTHTSVFYSNTNVIVDDVHRTSGEGYEICNRGNLTTPVTSTSNSILPIPISAENSDDVIDKVNCFPSLFEHAHSAITHNASTTVCTDTIIVSNELEEISTNQEAIPGDNPLMILEGIRKKCVKI